MALMSTSTSGPALSVPLFTAADVRAALRARLAVYAETARGAVLRVDAAAERAGRAPSRHGTLGPDLPDGVVLYVRGRAVTGSPWSPRRWVRPLRCWAQERCALPPCARAPVA